MMTEATDNKKNDVLQRIRERIPLETKIRILLQHEYCELMMPVERPLTSSQRKRINEWADRVTKDIMNVVKDSCLNAFSAGNKFGVQCVAYSECFIDEITAPDFDAWAAQHLFKKQKSNDTESTANVSD